MNIPGDPALSPSVAGKLAGMPKVLTGSDILANDNFACLAGRRIGFVGNHTSRLADGTPTHVALHNFGSVDVVRLFSPEHGAFGREDHENVADDRDPATGLLIHSLYGSTRKPTPDMLDGLDTLVFELQDVGARFYTYASTMLLCLEAASEARIPLVVLDRPNPLGGVKPFEGTLPDADKRSFVVAGDIPVRHGLTLGEIAKIAQRERALPARALEVVACAGYRRGMWWDETDLPWVSPSPAMQSLATATVYPGVCLLEQANVSVGRGTEDPFLLSGAPWIDGGAWSNWINDNAGPGVYAEPVEFVPKSSKYQYERCRGVHLTVSDRDAFASVRLGIAMIAGLCRQQRNAFRLEEVNVLLANDSVIRLIESQASVDEICSSWLPELQSWKEKVAGDLIYQRRFMEP